MLEWAIMSSEKNKQPKYIFVTGGVLSGVGKGITAASVGAVMKSQGLSVSIQKCDPYLNVDSGLLNPKEHGECFVTKDGAETDLDLGHYERFLDTELTQKNSTLAGRLLRDMIQKERNGDYKGQTVQMVPHFKQEIQNAIVEAGEGSDVHIVEIGGTVGDYESLSFIEAIRSFTEVVGRQNCFYMHVVYVPYISASGEFKSKPAQNAMRDLRGFGITPDAVVVRSEDEAPKDISRKIAMYGGVSEDAVIMMPNVKSVFLIPERIFGSGLMKILNQYTGCTAQADLSVWKELAKKQLSKKSKKSTIGIVAKYLDNDDTYISIVEALKSASWWQDIELEIKWINAEEFKDEELANVDGILVPGGFGVRGFEGKVHAADFALKNNIPYLGICLGMQVAVVAAARRGGVVNATSEETDIEGENVIYILKNQEAGSVKGGTLRLGDYLAELKEGSLVEKIYGDFEITERHRHRYEVNIEYKMAIENGGLAISGYSPDGSLVEFVEAKHNNFFVATQAHPEFKSRPTRPHPLFVEFLKKTC